MDVLRLLEDEHDQAKSVFKKLEKAEGDAAGRLWDQLKSMLTLHEEMEERVCDAWAMCVPKFLVRERLGDPPR